MKQLIDINDSQVESELIENGYAKTHLLSKEQLQKLRNIYENHFSYATQGDKVCLDSNADCSPDKKKIISDEIHKIVKPSIDILFSNYEFIPAIFFIKKPSKDTSSAIPMHQDPSLLIDECDKKHIKIWCPLHDVNESNGTMFMVRGSHRFMPPISAVTVPSHYTNVQEQLYSYLECVPHKAGEALIFDNRTLHYSSPNHSKETRITAIISIVAPCQQFISLYKNPNLENSPIEVYFQDKNWFYHPLWKNDKNPPLTGKKRGILDYNLSQVTPEELSMAYKKMIAIKNYKYNIIKDKKNFLSMISSYLRH